MIHHRLEKYNPVMWIGSRELAHPFPKHVTGAHVFVFQPEKRQEEVRKLCQAEQVKCGARVKYEGSSHLATLRMRTSLAYQL